MCTTVTLGMRRTSCCGTRLGAIECLYNTEDTQLVSVQIQGVCALSSHFLREIHLLDPVLGGFRHLHISLVLSHAFLQLLGLLTCLLPFLDFSCTSELSF